MIYYQVLHELKLPVKILTYSFEQDLDAGQIVRINIRGKTRGGLVIGKISETQVNDIQKIKLISEIVPVKFSQAQINFLFAFAYNTFNSPNNVLAAMLNPIDMLAKKYLTQIDNQFQKEQNNTDLETKDKTEQNSSENKIEPKSFKKMIVEPTLDFAGTDISLRIIYLIRNHLSNNPQKPILVIFPEKKTLYSVVYELAAELRDFQTNIYVAEKNIDSQTAVTNLLNNQARIIFSTRQGLFLPWRSLASIILIDEANSFYIQDQNQLYYDARDGAFFLAQNFVTNLTFIATLPSVRLQNFYPDQVSDFMMVNKLSKHAKPLKINLLKRERKSGNFDTLLGELNTEKTMLFFEDEENEEFTTS